jgi:L-malate glycosyltransferase
LAKVDPLSARLRILHITPWFPSPEKPSKGIFIQRHIELLKNEVDQHTVVVDADFGKWQWRKERTNDVTRYTLRCPLRIWRLLEWMSAWAVRGVLREHRNAPIDQVHFHIAYPVLAASWLFRSLLPRRVFIVEQSSLYHYQFHSPRKIKRVQRMFDEKRELIVISRCLQRDLEAYCERPLKAHLLRNVVHLDTFHPNTGPRKHQIVMAALWAAPKDPLSVIDDYARAKTEQLPQLIIAGGGTLAPDIQAAIVRHGLSDRIAFVGMASPEQLAAYLRESMAMLLPTHFETFSVICAEALACGTPVITRQVGALAEWLPADSTVFKADNESWVDAIGRCSEITASPQSIAAHARAFAPDNVRREYLRIIAP